MTSNLIIVLRVSQDSLHQLLGGFVGPLGLTSKRTRMEVRTLHNVLDPAMGIHCAQLGTTDNMAVHFYPLTTKLSLAVIAHWWSNFLIAE